MDQPGLDRRHRDKNGEIARKHGNTTVRRLRQIYGAGFAQGFPDTALLSEVLQKLDVNSLSAIHRHHDEGVLEGKIKGTAS